MVSPDGKIGYIYDAWRGDNLRTTAGDVFNQYKDMAKGQTIHRKLYDWSSADFGTIAQRLGEPFMKAEKSHELGENLVNTLLKYDMLYFFDTEEVRKIGTEMLTLQKSTLKKDAVDDLCDAVRYNCVSAPWDLSGIEHEQFNLNEKKGPPTKEELVEAEIEERRNGFKGKKKEDDLWGIAEEMEYWNDLYGN